jgi:hypothetical protein
MKNVKYTKVKCFTVKTENSYLNFTYKTILKTLKLGPQTTISYSGKRKKANFFLKLSSQVLFLYLIQIWYEFTRDKTAKSSNLNGCAINYKVAIYIQLTETESQEILVSSIFPKTPVISGFFWKNEGTTIFF